MLNAPLFGNMSLRQLYIKKIALITNIKDIRWEIAKKLIPIMCTCDSGFYEFFLMQKPNIQKPKECWTSCQDILKIFPNVDSRHNICDKCNNLLFADNTRSFIVKSNRSGWEFTKAINNAYCICGVSGLSLKYFINMYENKYLKKYPKRLDAQGQYVQGIYPLNIDIIKYGLNCMAKLNLLCFNCKSSGVRIYINGAFYNISAQYFLNNDSQNGYKLTLQHNGLMLY